MTTYERITFRPEGALRSRTMILRDPSIVMVAGKPHLAGVQVNREGDECGMTNGADLRRHIITLSLVSKRVPLTMDRKYAVLVADGEKI